MNNIVVCITCGSTIGKKFFEFQKLAKSSTDNSEILKKLNITRLCCKSVITTGIPESRLYRDYEEENQKGNKQL